MGNNDCVDCTLQQSDHIFVDVDGWREMEHKEKEGEENNGLKSQIIGRGELQARTGPGTGAGRAQLPCDVTIR